MSLDLKEKIGGWDGTEVGNIRFWLIFEPLHFNLQKGYQHLEIVSVSYSPSVLNDIDSNIYRNSLLQAKLIKAES